MFRIVDIDRIKNTLYSDDMYRRIRDVILAKILYSLPERFRRFVFRGTNYYCPICDQSLRSFIRLHRDYHLWCPVCRSLQRHRFVWYFLQKHTSLFDGKSQSILHVAPEPALKEKIETLPKTHYISADLYAKNALLRMDLCHMQFLDQVFDMVYCSHVLEHVPDDQLAMREIVRVLKPHGVAILLVPITTDVTFEDRSITDPVQREKVYGQHDHLRNYGLDFAQRLERNGFTVISYRPDQLLSAADIEKCGIDPHDTIFACTRLLV